MATVRLCHERRPKQEDLRLVPIRRKPGAISVLFARNVERNGIRDENRGDRELLSLGGWCQNLRKDRVWGRSFCALTPPPMAALLGGGVATYAGRGEFDAPRESLSTAVRRLSRGGCVTHNGDRPHHQDPHRYTSREVLLGPGRRGRSPRSGVP